MDLDAIYLMQRFHISENAAHCRDFCYNCCSSFIEHGIIDVKSVEQTMGASITQMRIHYRDDGLVDEEDFEKTCDEAKCRICPFFTYCHG